MLSMREMLSYIIVKVNDGELEWIKKGNRQKNSAGRGITFLCKIELLSFVEMLKKSQLERRT